MWWCMVERPVLQGDGLDSLVQNGSSNTDSQEIKNVASDNREKIDAIRRELAAMSRQAKQSYIERPSAAPAIDNDVLNAIQRKLTELENYRDTSSTENIEKTLSGLLENLNNKQNHIEALYKHIQTLQEVKADKDIVAIEMDYKADKAALESKVNTSTFDSTFTLLDEGLREALQKMDDNLNEELALKNTLQQLSCDMKEKMDTEAFKTMQNYLEKRIADVQKSRTMIAREANVDLSGAAGLRRPLPINFHCISCNRPIEVKYNREIEPSLPKADSIQMKKSKGPFLSYELDQQIKSSSREEQPVTQPNWTRDVSIIDFVKGTDGHVYKGRYKTVPPISKRHKQTPSESDLPPLTKDPSPPLTGHKWSSEPELSRTRGEDETTDEGKPTTLIKHVCITPPASTNSFRNSRYKRLLNERASDVEPNPVPSPSPPTARENEYQHRIDREEFLMQQQQELAQERLFSPRKESHGKRAEQAEDNNGDQGELIQRVYSPHSPKLTRSPVKSGGKKHTNAVGLDLTNRRMSADSLDDVIS
ncbi:hypothetical protein QZH41_011642 [Actinostola sp. cb2023]|nr:hypothetical protein QZH41_011642 [Actinostola sp. cb2023]